ncbi:hypothetical protein ACHAWF_009407, partial [Thalassiosira exigua]
PPPPTLPLSVPTLPLSAASRLLALCRGQHQQLESSGRAAVLGPIHIGSPLECDPARLEVVENSAAFSGMSNQLRQRNVPQPSVRDADSLTMANYDESRLSAGALLAASPTHAAPAMKMHVPVFYAVLPATVQWFLMRCCPRGWSPQWKRRHLVAVGEYLYRFKDEGGSSPKGAPIPVTTLDARIVSNGDDEGEFGLAFNLLPEGCTAVFEISSVGKTQYFAVETREEAMTWVNSLQQMRQDAITRNMGHSRDVPYPPAWKSFDASAKRLREQKTRIKNRLEAMDRKEQEMQSLGGSGGVGYFG